MAATPSKQLKRAHRRERPELPLKWWAAMVGECWQSRHPLQGLAMGWCLRKGSSLGQAVS